MTARRNSDGSPNGVSWASTDDADSSSITSLRCRRADGQPASSVDTISSAAEVEKAKALAETDFWSSLVDVDGKAEALGHYETALGDFRRVNVIAERLTQVTADDVARVVRQYLLPQRRTVVIAEPESDDADEDDADAKGGD